MNEEKARFTRVAEGIYRYQSGGFYLRTRLSGKQVWHKLKSADLQAARREARDILQHGVKVERRQASRTIQEFSDDEVARYRSASEKTRKKVEGFHAKLLAHWPHGEKSPVSRATKSDVERCISDAVGDCGASYYNQFVQYLRRVFNRALADRAIGCVPGAEPGTKNKDTVWRLKKVFPAGGIVPTVEQWRSVVKAIRENKFSDTRQEAADTVEAFALLGLGQAEVASLCWQDVNFQAGTLSVRRRKTGVPFTVPLNSAAVDLLRRRVNITGGTPTAKIFTIYSPKKAIETACVELGCPKFTPKSFRKLYITEALRAGVSVKVIAEMQGHQDGGKLILRTYSAEVNAEELAKAGGKMSSVFGQPVGDKKAKAPAGRGSAQTRARMKSQS